MFLAFEYIAAALVIGQIRAAGSVMEDNNLIWIPAAAWERPAIVPSETCTPLAAVARGEPLQFRIAAPARDVAVYPLLQTRDLAAICRAEWLPPAPHESILAQISEAAGPILNDTARPRIRAEPKRARTGPRPDVFESVVAIMRSELREGKITLAELADMKKEVMPERYPGGATTCMKARKTVLETASNCDRTANNDK